MRVDNPTNVTPAGAPSGDWASKAASAASRVSVSANAEPLDSIVLPRTQDLSSVQFAIDVDAAAKEIVVKMVDQTTGEVVRQIPAETILRMARAINEMIAAQSDTGTQGK